MQNTDTIEANREYYRKSAARYDIDEQPFVHQSIFLEKLLSRFDASSPNLHLLDFGAGTGSATQTLVKSFPTAKIVGLDVSPEMLAIASQKCPTASFNVFDGKQIPFASNSFDGVLISSVLHHVQDYERVLLEITRVCKTKGWILITQEPNPPVARCANRMRRLLARDLPDLVKRAEGYQFSKEGGIPPHGIIDTLTRQGFSCELIYNNDALLDRFLSSNRLLYHLLKPICRLRLLPWYLSYNVLAERTSSTLTSLGRARKSGQMGRGPTSAIARGVVAAVLTACLLGVGLRFFFPEIMDNEAGAKTMSSAYIGAVVWLAAAGIGILVSAVSQKKKRS